MKKAGGLLYKNETEKVLHGNGTNGIALLHNQKGRSIETYSKY
jgi:hypothetical protein